MEYLTWQFFNGSFYLLAYYNDYYLPFDQHSSHADVTLFWDQDALVHPDVTLFLDHNPSVRNDVTLFLGHDPSVRNDVMLFLGQGPSVSPDVTLFLAHDQFVDHGASVLLVDRRDACVSGLYTWRSRWRRTWPTHHSSSPPWWWWPGTPSAFCATRREGLRPSRSTSPSWQGHCAACPCCGSGSAAARSWCSSSSRRCSTCCTCWPETRTGLEVCACLAATCSSSPSLWASSCTRTSASLPRWPRWWLGSSASWSGVAGRREAGLRVRWRRWPWLDTVRKRDVMAI